MASQLAEPQGKMYMAARYCYAFCFQKQANPLKGCCSGEGMAVSRRKGEKKKVEIGKERENWEAGDERRKEGAREGGSARLSERERKRKKVHTVPQFFVEHLALTLPCFFSSLPPHTHIHTLPYTHRPTDLQDTVVASLLYLPQCCFNTYLHYNSVLVPTGRSKQD